MAGGVTVKRDLWRAIKANVRLAAGSYVAVGFPSEKDKPHKGRKGMEGMTNAQVAIANEVGTAPGVEPYRPARPFMQKTVDREGKNATEALTVLGKQIARGEMRTSTALNRMGKQMAGEIKRSFTAEKFDRLSKMTIAIKGSEQPLIDTGNLRQSVTWKVRMKGAKA